MKLFNGQRHSIVPLKSYQILQAPQNEDFSLEFIRCISILNELIPSMRILMSFGFKLQWESLRTFKECWKLSNVETKAPISFKLKGFSDKSSIWIECSLFNLQIWEKIQVELFLKHIVILDSYCQIINIQSIMKISEDQFGNVGIQSKSVSYGKVAFEFWELDVFKYEWSKVSIMCQWSKNWSKVQRDFAFRFNSFNLKLF